MTYWVLPSIFMQKLSLFLLNRNMPDIRPDKWIKYDLIFTKMLYIFLFLRFFKQFCNDSTILRSPYCLRVEVFYIKLLLYQVILPILESAEITRENHNVRNYNKMCINCNEMSIPMDASPAWLIRSLSGGLVDRCPSSWYPSGVLPLTLGGNDAINFGTASELASTAIHLQCPVN